MFGVRVAVFIDATQPTSRRGNPGLICEELQGLRQRNRGTA